MRLPWKSPLKLVTRETFHVEMSPQRIRKCCRSVSLAADQSFTAALSSVLQIGVEGGSRGG